MTRLNQFDILKAIGIILVIVGHTIGYNIVRNMICSFHMPLFFLVSGYFFSVKAPLTLFKKLYKRLLIPYLLSCSIIILLNVIIVMHTRTFDAHYLLNWLQSIVYGNGVTTGTQFQSIGPLWFLLALFWSTIILHLLLYFQQYVSPIFTSILCVITALYLSDHKITLPLSISQGMFGVGFLYIGYLVKQHYPSITSRSKLELIPIAIIWIVGFKSGYLSVVQCYAKPELATLAGAVCGTYLAYVMSNHIAQKENKLCSIFTYIGRMTLLILCVHSIEDSVVPWQNYINNIDLNHYLSSSFIISIRILLVISFSWILLKIKIVQKIFST